MNRRLLVFTIFLGSFLSFALEPMIGRTLLPVFGGTPSVWVTCLAAFQVLMVGGYFYARFASAESEELRVKSEELRVKSFWQIHLLLLILAAGWCAGVGFAKGSILTSLSGLTGVPALDVLISVIALSGVTFILLSANATVVQVLSGGDYRLYAVSNAGSLAGLLAYPLLFEPHMALTHQWYGLGLGVVAYAALLWRAARGARGREDGRRETGDVRGEDERRETGDARRTILYLVIPGVSCALLNATTSHLTLDVAPLPLLWAVLLALFLVSYIIGFSGKAKPERWAIPAALFALAAVHFDGRNSGGAKYLLQLATDAGLVLCASTFLHAYLYSIRPGEKGLARYYLFNVIGGAAGGVLTSIVAPLVFDTVAEFPLVIAVGGGGVAAWCLPRWRRVVAIVSFALAALTVGLLVRNAANEDTGDRRYVAEARGFFGTIYVTELKAKLGSGAEGTIHEYVHGSTVHGSQVRIPGKWRMPTCYYSPESVGYAIVGHPKYRSGEPMRVNLLGMGVGVLFAYGRTNDYYRAYEISKDALDVATNTNLFSFVADCPAKKDVVLCDARKGLEAELAAGVEPYDVIVVDAFSGDNVPYHLSSREAIELYFKMLKPDGILCIHISNWHLALERYVKTVGEAFDCPLLGFNSPDGIKQMGIGATVALLCRQPDGLAPPPVGPGKGCLIDFEAIESMGELPTDEKGSFLSLVNVWR